jgi:Polyketide cyclase / dehydrase and lipid transport
MGRIRVAVEIDATPGQVWSVVEPIERHVDWMADAVEIRFTTEATRGVGTAFECDTKVGPITLTDEMTVTEWEPERTMGVRHTGIVTGTGVFELEPIDLGRRTRFTWTEELSFPWYLGGRLGEIVGGQAVMKQIWKRNLRRLRTLVENPAR